MDRFSKLCLSLIVLLLFVIALRPMALRGVVHAAEHKYVAVTVPPDATQTSLQGTQSALDKYTADGWDFMGDVGRPDGMIMLFFRKQ